MKKIIFTTLLTFFIAVQPVLSQNTTSVPTPTASLVREVDKLKEIVEEQVSESKQKNEKAISGVVKSVSKDEIVISRSTGGDATLSVDDTLTSFYEIQGTVTKEVKQSTILKNDYIFVLGPEISGVFTANAIYKDQKYLTITGKITKVSSDDFTLSVISLDKTNYTIDIQTKTVQEMLNIKTSEIDKIGFSKFKEGDSIHVVVRANLENSKSTRYDGERILIIPNEYFIQ